MCHLQQEMRKLNSETSNYLCTWSLAVVQLNLTEQQPPYVYCSYLAVQMIHNSVAPHLIKDLQVEGVHPRRHRALDHLVPPWVLGSIVSSRCLIDCIAQSDPTVWIHPGHPIVFSKLGLHSKIKKEASLTWYVQVSYCDSWAGRVQMCSVDGGIQFDDFNVQWGVYTLQS